MHFRAFLVLVFLLVLTGPLSAKTIIIGGARPAKLLTPTNASNKGKIPLIILLHGYTDNAERADAYFGISKQRDSLGFAIILPHGSKDYAGLAFWNATPECCDFGKTGIDDSGYIAELIREAATVTAIDLDRVYLIGHSNGGFMGYRMACDYPDMIRGVISISGAFFADPRLCKNPGRLNLLQIHGSNDSVVDFRGRFGFPGAKQSVKYWVNSQSCNQEATVRRHQLNLMPFYASNKAAGYETDSYVWGSCQNEAHVGLWKVNGADHMPFFKSTWLAEALYFVK